MIIKAQKKSKILFGTDPEASAVYEKEGKLYALPPYFFRKVLGVPSIDPIGDGRHPEFFEEPGEFKAIEDGANFEFIIRPSFDPKDLFDRIQACSEQVSQRILRLFPEHCLPNLHFLPTVGWDVKRWENMPEDFFMSTTFGCDPDIDIFNTETASREIDASLHPERYDGGHLHTSGSYKIAEDPNLAVMCMLVTAGMAATAFSDVPDLEKQRLFLYGKPGRMRVQEYGKNPFGPEYAVGIEYRTLSARWAGNWDIAKEVLKWAEIGITTLLETSLGDELIGEVLQPAKEAVLSANQPLARQILSHIESKL